MNILWEGKQEGLSSRREHLVRMILQEYFLIFAEFQNQYQIFLQGPVTGENSCKERGGEIEVSSSWTALLQAFAPLVGTEKDHGPLWRLKDLCHQVWPQDMRQHHLHGVVVDWLFGSLFHEAMKLKENLYLISRYGPAAWALDDLADSLGAMRQYQSIALMRMVDIGALIHRITNDASRQMERISSLFGQINYLLRIMLPELTENPLVLRLLAESEAQVNNLWGETLTQLFSDIFADTGERGFCLTAASYYQGQWYPQAFSMYQRALTCNSQCSEALIRLAQLTPIVQAGEGKIDQAGSSRKEK